MIKNLEQLKQYNIICTNTDEVEECLEILKKLGFDTYEKEIYCEERIVKYCVNNCFCSTKNITTEYKDINFRSFKKQTKKFLKEKEEKVKEELPDFEFAEDGRLTKINNYNNKYFNFLLPNINLDKNDIKNLMQLGLIYQNKFLEKATEKQKIYIQLKNLAERLNNSEKNDWNNKKQKKYFIYYDYNKKKLKEGYNNMCRNQGTIYCIDINFLDIAIKEIGEENLLKLFED